MATTRLFAYNTGTTIPFTQQLGNLAIGLPNNPNMSNNYAGVQWWNGPDEDLGYVIAYQATGQTTPITGLTAQVQFWRSDVKTENSFISLATYISNSTQIFSTGQEASYWLNSQDYWDSYSENLPTQTPTNTPTNTPTITPTNTPTITPTNTITPSETPTNTPTITPTPSPLPITFEQTDTTFTNGASAACSGRASATTVKQLTAIDGGTPGTVSQAITLTNNATNVWGTQFKLTTTATQWLDGTWTWRFNVTTANNNITLTEVYICRVNSANVNQATMGSATGLAISCGTTGVKSGNITVTAQTPNTGDYVNVVYVFSNGQNMSNTVSFTSNQVFDTTIFL